MTTQSSTSQFLYDPGVWADYGLGTILRSFREAYGQTLYQVADHLKIRAVYLQYLEDGYYDGLPGYAHGLGFLKSYAEYLGLPVAEMIERYRNDTGMMEPVQVRPVEAAPLQRFEQRIPFRIALGVLACILVAFYLGSFVFNELNLGKSQAPTLVNRISSFFLNKEVVPEPDPNAVQAQPAAANEAGTTSTSGSDTTPAIATANGEAAPTAAPGAVTRAPATGAAGTPIRVLRTEERPPLSEGMAYIPQIKPNMAALVGDTNTITVGNAPPALAGEGGTGGLAPTSIISPLAVQASDPAATGGTGLNGTQFSPLDGLAGLGQGPIVIGPAPTPIDPTVPTPQQTNAGIAPASSGTETPVTNELPAAPLIEPITITSKRITWLQIRNQEDNLVQSAVLRPGESLEVPPIANLKLVVESFNNIDITVSGRQVPQPQTVEPGKSVFPLDAQRLRAGL